MYINKINAYSATVFLLAVILLGYSSINAAWSNPAGAPPSNNVAAPLNVSSAAQDKPGVLGLSGLGVFGDASINSGLPLFKLQDTTAGAIDFWAAVENNAFYLFADRNSDNSWTEASPLTMITTTDTNGVGDLASFSDRVGAHRYCDTNGQNCFSTQQLINGCPEGEAVNRLNADGTVSCISVPQPVSSEQTIFLNSSEEVYVAAKPGTGGDRVIYNGSAERFKTCNTALPGSVAVNWESKGWNSPGDNTATIFNGSSWSTVGASAYNNFLTKLVCQKAAGATVSYAWIESGWSSCQGTQTRTVICKSSTFATVSDSNCTAAKPATSQSCTVYQEQNSTCFIAGTKVTMADNTVKNIEEVMIGESVRGDDGAINTVLGYDRPMLGTRLLYSFNGGSYFVTAEHPFLTTDGWKSIDPAAFYAEHPVSGKDLVVTTLTAGDTILMADGSRTLIERIDSKSAPDQQLYNLMLDGNHTYYVDGYATHNKHN